MMMVFCLYLPYKLNIFLFVINLCWTWERGGDGGGGTDSSTGCVAYRFLRLYLSVACQVTGGNLICFGGRKSLWFCHS